MTKQSSFLYAFEVIVTFNLKFYEVQVQKMLCRYKIVNHPKHRVTLQVPLEQLLGALSQRPEVVLCSMENLADPRASCNNRLAL